MSAKQPINEPLGNPAPFAEPSWLNALASPYYNDSHRNLQRAVRQYLEDNVFPYVEEWEENGQVPVEAKRRYAQAGLAFQEMPAEYAQGVKLPGGVSFDEWDIFHFIVLHYELNRIACGGVMGGLGGALAIGVPPVVHHGTEEQKKKWLNGIFLGETSFCLGATEPTGGSDLANLKTTARKTNDSKSYIVNGHKKWISGGLAATHMTTAVRTGGHGASGVSVLVIPLDLPGISRRKIKNSGFNAGESTWVTLDNVVVPAENLIGEENHGFGYLMTNFNRERLIMAVGMNSLARVCLEDAWAYALDRQTFGEPLFSHQIIRHKLATLARYIESHWAWIEQIAYHVKVTGDVGPELASRIALAKVHGGRLLELANREAQQIFGGAGYQRGGVGSRVEQISRDLRVSIVGGGSEEIITDLAVRQEMAQSKKRGAKLFMYGNAATRNWTCLTRPEFIRKKMVTEINPNFTSQPPSCSIVELSFPAPYVMVVTINREHAMNSIPMDGHWEGEAVWSWFDDEPSLRAAILTGKGSKAFSAGADLHEVGMTRGPGKRPQPMPPGGFLGLSRRIGKKPVIAAVNGYAYGGGFELALNCDLVIASPTAKFSLPEVKRGLYAGAGGLPRVVRTFGMQLAGEIALTGRVLPAEELKQYGFLRISSSPDSLQREALQLAEDVAAQSPDGIIVTRAGLRQAWEMASVERSAQIIDERYNRALLEGENMRIGIEAFAKKQKPAWVPSKM
ncbi:Fc.00g058740.m01.CDS01 [Cosmosporella sp. VM-42]